MEFLDGCSSRVYRARSTDVFGHEGIRATHVIAEGGGLRADLGLFLSSSDIVGRCLPEPGRFGAVYVAVIGWLFDWLVSGYPELFVFFSDALKDVGFVEGAEFLGVPLFFGEPEHFFFVSCVFPCQRRRLPAVFC